MNESSKNTQSHSDIKKENYGRSRSTFSLLFYPLEIQKCWRALGSLCTVNNYLRSLWKHTAPFCFVCWPTPLWKQIQFNHMCACVRVCVSSPETLKVSGCLTCWFHAITMSSPHLLPCCVGRRLRRLTVTIGIWKEETSLLTLLTFCFWCRTVSQSGKFKCSELLFNFYGMVWDYLPCFRFVTVFWISASAVVQIIRSLWQAGLLSLNSLSVTDSNMMQMHVIYQGFSHCTIYSHPFKVSFQRKA